MYLLAGQKNTIYELIIFSLATRSRTRTLRGLIEQCDLDWSVNFSLIAWKKSKNVRHVGYGFTTISARMQRTEDIHHYKMQPKFY